MIIEARQTGTEEPISFMSYSDSSLRAEQKMLTKPTLGWLSHLCEKAVIPATQGHHTLSAAVLSFSLALRSTKYRQFLPVKTLEVIAMIG